MLDYHSTTPLGPVLDHAARELDEYRADVADSAGRCDRTRARQRSGSVEQPDRREIPVRYVATAPRQSTGQGTSRSSTP